MGEPSQGPPTVLEKNLGIFMQEGGTFRDLEPDVPRGARMSGRLCGGIVVLSSGHGRTSPLAGWLELIEAAQDCEF